MSPVNRDASPYTLRSYQEHTVAANRAAHLGMRRPTGTGRVNRTANVLATGLGKTVIFSQMIADAHQRFERSIVLVHRSELAEQAMRKVHSMAPGASIGLVKGSRNEWDADVVVASVPSIGTERQMLRRRIPADRFKLGIADENHHSAADTWQFAMGYFGAFRDENGGGMPWAGFTATLSRGDSRALGDTWQEIVADYDIGFGVRNRFLVKPRGIRIRVKDLMLDEVKRSRGDFQDEDLGAAMVDADAGNTMVKAYLEHIPGKRTAGFAPSVYAAKRFAEAFAEAGISTEVITGSTPDDQRQGIYERFRLGATLVIWSVGVLTEGWDAPWCEAILNARPTESAALYIQIVGRALRTWPGKAEAVILDVVGSSVKHRLVSLKDLAGGVGDPRETIESYTDEDGTEELQGEYIDPNVKDFLAGELVAEEVDLFADSDSAWLQTDGGVWFVPTRESYWFLAHPPNEGGFRLGRIPANGGKAYWAERELTLEAGMAWAERYAGDEDPSISSRSASWRKSKPSQAMAAKAVRLGLPVEGLRQGELGDLITVGHANIVLRKYASRV
jgi:superfamily II DNA or RNA helicase